MHSTDQEKEPALDRFDQDLGDIPAELAESLLRCNDRRPEGDAPLPVAAFASSL